MLFVSAQYVPKSDSCKDSLFFVPRYLPTDDDDWSLLWPAKKAARNTSRMMIIVGKAKRLCEGIRSCHQHGIEHCEGTPHTLNTLFPDVYLDRIHAG